MNRIKEFFEKSRPEYEKLPEIIEKKAVPTAEFLLMGNLVRFRKSFFALVTNNIPALTLKIISQVA